MFNWNDFINDFPYTNFSDINVSWFLNKFKQIFDEWQGLYTQLQNWKTETDEYNANWRAEQEQAFATWENNFENAIDEWKAQTETDIGTWENETLANLETWKTTFITQYNELKAEVEQIAEDAETAKNSAQASATSAQQSADSASATALALQASLAQIDENRENIEDLTNNKVPFPIGDYSKYGNSGQTLKTLGNGLTEWTDVGTPTDSQAETTINKWLNEHPEATTTVLDNSLTYNKLVTGTLGYVTPEMFGAKRDGVTDDSLAIQNAINSRYRVLFLNGTYTIGQTLYIDQYTSLIGTSGAWGGSSVPTVLTGTVLKALPTFEGDYIFKINHDNKNYCRSVVLENIGLDCNTVTGGILAYSLYDASTLKNINIVRVGYDKYGINIEYAGKVTQTLEMENVICVADTTTQRDGAKALINLEGLQECTLINVKSFTKMSNSMRLAGCETVTLIDCAVFDYDRNEIYNGYLITNQSEEDNEPHAKYTRNITLINCLNEQCVKGLTIDTLYYTFTGNFENIVPNSIITQNDAKGVIGSLATSERLTVYPITGTFTTGECSIGTISTITDRRGNDFKTINYQPKVNEYNNIVTINGAAESVIEVNTTISDSSKKTNYNLSNNNNVKIILSESTTGIITNDNTTEIIGKTTHKTYTTSSSSIPNMPTFAYEGQEIDIYSDGESTQKTANFPDVTEYGTNSLKLNNFTIAKFKYINGKYHTIFCDGVIIKTVSGVGSEIVYSNEEQEIKTLTNTTTTFDAFHNKEHYTNAGATTAVYAQINVTTLHRKITFTNVDTTGHNIIVRFASTQAQTVPETTPDSQGRVNISILSGETKTFEVVNWGTVAVY